MNTKKEQWAMVLDNRRSTYYVSDKGRCKRVHKKTGREELSYGVRNECTGYICFAGGYVHRHVAKAFLPNVDNLPEVDHMNSNREDNAVSNLRWSTCKANRQSEHSRKMRSQHWHCTKHKDEVIRAEKDGEVQYFTNGYDAADKLNCSHVLVYNALNSKGSARCAKGWKLQWVAV